MKNNLRAELSTGANRAITEQDPFQGIDRIKTIPGYADEFLPAGRSFGLVRPLRKSNGRKAGLDPVFNFPMKQVAARLSEIELALECYNIPGLQSSTMVLKDLFYDMKMPAVYKLADQMEELAAENRFHEVKELLRGVKKIIGWIVLHKINPGTKISF